MEIVSKDYSEVLCYATISPEKGKKGHHILMLGFRYVSGQPASLLFRHQNCRLDLGEESIDCFQVTTQITKYQIDREVKEECQIVVCRYHYWKM
ncbi:Uncharacterized protein TCM_040770 [Theobroma cacao]|uniref:Uncharacterized protein n=1 Tax=Theobroma cacao TaxID=3641 RepID=A0A061GSE3_THECC|nr:Uncharacterized protein TCM_040770 [Theobroma cacao]